jgi:hypothetical protein
MFDPTRDQVREFFISAWQKRLSGAVCTSLQTMAANLVQWHPEYQDELQDPDALQRDYSVQDGRTNPFLHLSMHLAIAEQVSIDQPPGIKDVHSQLASRLGEHEAVHEIMECLGEVVWQAQRTGQPLNNETYLDLILRRATRDDR